jgi:hypothetical protein
MKNKFIPSLFILGLSLGAVSCSPPEGSVEESVEVTADTYVRAETDRGFQNFIEMAGGINRLFHFRNPTELDKQPVVRMNKDTAQYTSYSGMMGARGKVNEKTRHIACAAAWGLLPDADATYLNYSGEFDPKIGYKATYQVPENDAFWSITVYGNDGYMKSENNIVNSSNVELNHDGTFTVYYGSKELCGDVPNRLDVSEGWNFAMRIYRPGPSVLDGSYQVPAAEPIK